MDALISTQALADRLQRGDDPRPLRIFDATVHLRPAQPGPYVVESGRADYEASHIPSAAFVDLGQDLSDTRSALRFTLPPPAQLEAALSAAGLSNGDDCVVYSSSSPMWATRLWWMLRSMGFGAAVLDGGLPKWRAEGRALASGSERYPPGRFVAQPDAAPGRQGQGAARHRKRCGLHDQRAHRRGTCRHLRHPLRPQGAHQGQRQRALSVAARCRRLLQAGAGAAPGVRAVGALRKPRVICYCGGGISATMDAMALLLIGHPDVAVYDGSMSEWVRDPQLPMETGG